MAHSQKIVGGATRTGEGARAPAGAGWCCPQPVVSSEVRKRAGIRSSKSLFLLWLTTLRCEEEHRRVPASLAAADESVYRRGNGSGSGALPRSGYRVSE